MGRERVMESAGLPEELRRDAIDQSECPAKGAGIFETAFPGDLMDGIGGLFQ